MEITEITADYAKHLTNVVNEVDEKINHCEFPWTPIICAIKLGYNRTTMIIFSDDEKKFVDKLKELGYNVKIEEKRFWNQAVIEW